MIYHRAVITIFDDDDEDSTGRWESDPTYISFNPSNLDFLELEIADEVFSFDVMRTGYNTNMDGFVVHLTMPDDEDESSDAAKKLNRSKEWRREFDDDIDTDDDE